MHICTVDKPILMAGFVGQKWRLRAAGLDGGLVAYYTLNWRWLRGDARYTSTPFRKKKKKKKEFLPTTYLNLNYEVLTLNVFQD